MAIPLEVLPSNASKRLIAFSKFEKLPQNRFGKVVETLRMGSSIRHAAACAGLSNPELMTMLDWGISGYEPWVELFEQVRMAQGFARKQMVDCLYTRGREGDIVAMEKWMKMCDEDEADLAFMEANNSGGGGGGMNMTINVQKSFEPSHGFNSRGLPPGNNEVIEGQFIKEEE